MRGPEGARHLVADFLAAGLPAKVDELVTRLGLTDDQFPVPGLVSAEERDQVEPEEWPFVLVSARSSDDYKLVEVDIGGETYEVRYRVRVNLGVRADSYEDVCNLRDRYVLAVTELVFAQLDLDEAGVKVDPRRYNSTIEGVAAESNRSISGAYVQFEVTMPEVVDRTARDLESIEVTYERMD